VPDIKSAWEIAQEKASKLGGLSVEEREEQRQEECRLTGEALADKYLSRQDIGIIKDELGKHGAADKDLIGRAAVQRLSQAINLQYPNRLDEILQGILALKNSEAVKRTLEDIKVQFKEYTVAENRESQEIEKAAGEILHQMRISGSAIGRVNLRAKEEWQEKLDQTALPFNDRLNSLKQELTH
jgi:uncharacterized protein YerC